MIEIKHRSRNVDHQNYYIAMLVPKPYEHYTRINESAIDMEQIKGLEDMTYHLILRFTPRTGEVMTHP